MEYLSKLLFLVKIDVIQTFNLSWAAYMNLFLLLNFIFIEVWVEQKFWTLVMIRGVKRVGSRRHGMANLFSCLVPWRAPLIKTYARHGWADPFVPRAIPNCARALPWFFFLWMSLMRQKPKII